MLFNTAGIFLIYMNILELSLNALPHFQAVSESSTCK